MAGAIVFGLFVVAMLVLAGFVISFARKLGRERQAGGTTGPEGQEQP